MQLRFPDDHIPDLCRRYSYTRGEQQLIGLREQIIEAGCISKDQLKIIALWKSPRSAGHVEKNNPAFVREISTFAFAADNERARIEPLTLMNGVQWPMASVILHFFHKDPYPILDFRALWSVGLEVPTPYTFEFWWPYVEFCRSIATRNKVDMRTLDQALWQFSNENQSAGGSAGKKQTVKADSTKSQADRIREFVANKVIQPKLASGAKEIKVRAGDIHAAMGLKQRLPAVCSALASKKLADACKVEILHRDGPSQGSTATFTFRQRDSGAIQRQSLKYGNPEDVKGTVHLVSCVSRKGPSPTAAKDLYTSALFSKARAYVENTGTSWFVLSAKYGLVPPDEIIAPYDLTLNKMAIADRRDWAARVLEQLAAQAIKPQRIVMLAGARYREFLEPKLRSMGIEVEVPMEGLRIGEQLSWLSHKVQHD